MLQLPPLHNAEEMRFISNLAHWMEGAVIGAAALVALVQWRWMEHASRWNVLWPAIFTFAGLALLGYLFIPHHGIEHARAQWAFVLGEGQQRQHVFLAFLILIGGGIELANRLGRLRASTWLFVWPVALFVGGLLFVLHPQHGTSDAVERATLLHRILGALFIATGLVRGFEVVVRPRAAWLGLIWPSTLLLASCVLLSFREPPGAYESEGHSGHSAFR